MPRVNYVRAARKANPAVKAGEPYYWWKFRYGGKHFSRTRPRPSQLTQSEYLGQARQLIEQVEDASESISVEYAFEQVEGVEGAVKCDPSAVASQLEELRDDIVDTLERMADTCVERRYDMPENLQDSPTGELLGERADACWAAQGELEGLGLDFETSLDIDIEEPLTRAAAEAAGYDDADELVEALREELSEWVNYEVLGEMTSALENLEN